MTMWWVIMWTALALVGAAMVYVSNRVCRFGLIQCVTKNIETRKALIGGGVVIGLFVAVGLWLGFVNAMVCLIYFAMAFMIGDAVFFGVQKICRKKFSCYYGGVAAVIVATAALGYGWYLNHHVWQTDYYLTTTKTVEPLKIVMFADSHTGTTFNAEGFAQHVAAMQAQKPDAVIVAGDFVDDGTTREDMLATAKMLGKMTTTYGVYFVFGNHDNGYYGPAYRGFSGADLVQALEQNGVTVLRDETVLVDDKFYIIGRRDYSVEKEQHGKRLSMAELVKNLDKNKYIIVADHQPTDYDHQAEAKVDLVLSGHTHGGQLFPFNQVGKWIGANDRVYGYEKRKQTDFIVTSGLSDWAIKFKTGTRSEFVVIHLKGAE